MRKLYRTFQKLNFVPKLFVMFGIILLFPLLMLLPYPQEARYAPGFILPAVFTIIVGLLIHLRQRRIPAGRVQMRQKGVIVVVAVWLYAFVIGGFPFFCSGLLDFLRAVFESTSGWTTTGFTVIQDLESTPKIFLFYRGFMQFCGGLGFVLLMLLFAGGKDAMQLFTAEGHPDKLEANLISTARVTMMIYLGLTLGGTILYMCFGMSWFDAVNHAMSAMGTGGFSTRNENIAYYNSIPIEVVSIVLMLLGSTNFAILALLFKGQLKRFAKVGETRFFLVFMGIIIVLTAFLGVNGIYKTLGESVRVTVFQTVSAVSSTGFSIRPTSEWSAPMNFLVILLMLVGGGAGSTAGGIKYSRIYILYKHFLWELKGKFLPERNTAALTVYKTQGKVSIPKEQILQIHHFVLVYLASFFIGSALLTFGGLSIESAIYEFSSSLGTIGLSDGSTAAGTGNYILFIQLIGMILARLEVYIVYIFCAAGMMTAANALRGRRK